MSDANNRMARIESDLRLLKWMVGVNIALSMAMFWQGLTIMGRLN
jgi:hypothetical protein